MRKRSKYRPRPVTAETMTLALHYAAKPSAADRAQVIGLLREAVQALLCGVATERQWSVAAGSVTLALAIEGQGVVRGMHEHLRTTERALQSIHDRSLVAGAGSWRHVPISFHEHDALQTFLDLHQFQVDQLSRAEFLAAIKSAERQVAAQGCMPVIERGAAMYQRAA